MEEGMNDDMNQETIKAALRLYAQLRESAHEEDETFRGDEEKQPGLR